MPVKRKNTQDDHEHAVKRRCRPFNPPVPTPGDPHPGAPFVRRVLRAFSRALRLTVKIDQAPASVFFRETPVNYYRDLADQAPLELENPPLGPRGRDGRAKRKANYPKEREERLFKALHEEVEYAGKRYRGAQEVRKAVRMAEEDVEKGLSALNWLRGCNKMDFPTLVWVADVRRGVFEQTKDIQRAIVEGVERKVDKLCHVVSQGLETLSNIHKNEAEKLDQREAALEAALQAEEQLVRQERAQLDLENQAVKDERAQLEADKKALNDEREQALRTMAHHTTAIEDKIRAEYSALQKDLRRNARLKQHMELPELKKTAEALAEPMAPVTKLRFDRAVEQMSARCVREVQDGLNELTVIYEEKIRALTEMYEGREGE